MNKKGLKILLFVFLICFSLLTLSACEMEEDAPLYGYFSHSFSSWETIQEPTCETKGIQKRTCVLCGKEQIRYIENTGTHSSGVWRITLQPTCTEPGEETNFCPSCGEGWETRRIAPKGHSFGKWSKVRDKTCTQDGIEKRVCGDCGYEETRPIPASHEWKDNKIKEPTCTEPGEKSQYCEACGATKDKVIIHALGHNFGDWEITTPATCTEDGIKTRTCTRCSETDTETIPAPGHIDKDKDGYCDRCHKWVAPDDPIAVSVKIDDKISEYGKALKTLTYTVISGSIPDGLITLTKDPGDSVGSYPITGNCDSPYYNVTFDGVGTYYIITAGLKFQYADNAYLLTGYTGTATDVVVPGVYSDGTHGFKPVTQICETAFWRCDAIETVTLNENITKIDSCAFFGCSSLKSITIPASVEYIGNCAFSGCQSLASATFSADGWKRIAASDVDSYANWEAKSGGISTDLSDASNAATKLVSSAQYVDFYFYR